WMADCQDRTPPSDAVQPPRRSAFVGRPLSAPRGRGAEPCAGRGSAGPGDAEPAHACLERRALHAEDPRGTAVPADAPAHALEHREDVAPLDLLERPGPHRARLVDGNGNGGGGTGERLLQLESCAPGKDDRALDDVLELPDIPGPAVGHEL